MKTAFKYASNNFFWQIIVWEIQKLPQKRFHSIGSSRKLHLKMKNVLKNLRFSRNLVKTDRYDWSGSLKLFRMIAYDERSLYSGMNEQKWTHSSCMNKNELYGKFWKWIWNLMGDVLPVFHVPGKINSCMNEKWTFQNLYISFKVDYR